MITYKEQFDKLTRAYINGEVDPYDCEACFVGNMLDRNPAWQHQRFVLDEYWGDIFLCNQDNSKSYKLAVALIADSGYTRLEILDIEGNFLRTIGKNCSTLDQGKRRGISYENALFIAFESTLELLKQIHIAKGEIIDETPVFAKRQPQSV